MSCLCWALLALSSTAQVRKSRCLGKSNHPVYCVVAKEVTGFFGEQHLCLSDSEFFFFFVFFPCPMRKPYNRWCKITHSPELLVNAAREGGLCVGVLANLSWPNFPSAPALAPMLFLSKSPATYICCLCLFFSCARLSI